ncbi:hypothetical protein AAVH_01023 [Aphelenchoides avenae]|nr:hypothetical protein AAVH_01023 [Aphelenchus avenae]
MPSKRRAVIESEEEEEPMEAEELDSDPDEPGPSSRITKKRVPPARKPLPPSRSQPSGSRSSRPVRDARPTRTQAVERAQDSADEEPPANAIATNSQVRTMHCLVQLSLAKGSKGAIPHADLGKLMGKEAPPAREAKIRGAEHHLLDMFGLKLVRDKKGTTDRYFLGNNLAWNSVIDTRIETLIKGEALPVQNGEVDPGNHQNGDMEVENGLVEQNGHAVPVINGHGEEEVDDDGAAQQARDDGILIIILMGIFMIKRHTVEDEPGVPESIIREFITKVNGHVNEEQLKKVLAITPPSRFLSHGWLSATKATENDEALYDWGPRAKIFEILDTFCEMYQVPREMWIDQLAAATRQAG